MIAKVDPYATARARVVDLALIFLAILLVAIAIFTSPRHRSDAGATSLPPTAQMQVNLASNTTALGTTNH